MKTLNEQISRIKQMMNINEDENAMALFQQDTEAFNQEADEDLTVEEYKEVACEAQSGSEPEMDSAVMAKIDQEGRNKIAKVVEAMKRANLEQLKEEKRKFKQALASKNATDMQEQGALATVLVFGEPLGWVLVVATSWVIIGFMLYYIIKAWLNKNPNRRRNCTDPIL